MGGVKAINDPCECMAMEDGVGTSNWSSTSLDQTPLWRATADLYACDIAHAARSVFPATLVELGEAEASRRSMTALRVAAGQLRRRGGKVVNVFFRKCWMKPGNKFQDEKHSFWRSRKVAIAFIRAPSTET